MKRSNKIFGVTALFDTPDQIIHAAKKTSSEFKDFDVHTPYPVHGMDAAMKLKPSKLGYITLAFGLTGAGLALLLMFWTMSVAYPMVIGGKPFFALPAFIPVTFEVTVLLATLSTVFGMLTFFFKFPHNTHPLHDTDYMKAVSLDKYGVFIGAEDEKFSIEKAKEFLGSLGGKSIDVVYDVDKNIYDAFSPKFLGIVATVAIVVSAGTYITLNKVMYTTPFNWMDNQFKSNPQKPSDFFADGSYNRPPVKGTVARGFIPYEFTGQTADKVLGVVNPTIPGEANLKLGQKKYLTFCSPCHGNYGDGDSRLRGQFPNPPSLHTTKLREWEDGQIYHVITAGQNTMPSYAPMVTREERWAIVNYIRVLQKAKNATQADVDEVRKEMASNGK